jgi:hypothetical protein
MCWNVLWQNEGSYNVLECTWQNEVSYNVLECTWQNEVSYNVLECTWQNEVTVCWNVLGRTKLQCFGMFLAK